MAVIGQAEILLTANTASFTTEMDRARSVSQRTARQIERDQQQQASARLQIERQYASEHRRIEMALTDEVERIRAARFNSADEQRYIAQARANAQQQVDLIAEQERAATNYGEKAKVAFGYAAVGAGIAAAAIVGLVKEQIELVNQLDQVALKANMSASSIQKYTIGASAVGIEMDKLGDIFKDTQDKVGDFLTTGGGEMQDFFDNVAPKVGVTADQFRNLSGPDALQLYYNSLEKANLSQNEMVFYMEAVADEASTLIPLLHDNAAGFKAWEKAAENAGAKMDEKTIRATQELKTSTELLNLSFKGVKNQIAQAFLPVLSDLASAMVQDTTLKDKARIAGEVLAKGFKGIINVGLGVVGIFRMIGTTAGALAYAITHPLQAIDTMKTAWADLKNIYHETNKAMDTVLDAGTSGRTNTYVSQLTDYTIATEKYKAKLGETGAQIQANAEKEKEAAKEREKIAKEQASGKYAPLPVNSTVLAHASRYGYSELEKRYGLPAGLLSAVSMQESRGNPGATSPVGAKGEFQFMPGTAARFGIAGQERNTAVAAVAAAKYLASNLRMFGDLDKAIAAYNAGEGNVKKYGGIPPFRETKGYVKGVRGYLSFMNGGKAISSGYDVAGALANDAQEAERARTEAERQAKEQYDLQMKYVTEFADEKTKLYLEHTAKETEIGKINDAALREQLLKTETTRYQNKVDLLQLEYDKQTQKATEWQQSEEERIIANAELERREAALTLTNDVNLRQAKIDAINAQEQESLRQLRAGFESELAGITDYSKSELERIRQEGQRQINALANRKDINPSQKDEMAAAIKGRTETEAQRVQREAATGFNNLNATMSGTSEWQSLQDQYVARQQIVDNALKAEVISKQQHKDAMLAIDKAYANDSNLLAMAQGQQILGSVTSSLKATLGEHNKAYRVMFAVEKGVNIARSLMAINTGIAMAAANPFPMNLGAMVSVAAATASIVSDLMAIKNPVGQAHDGIMSVPESGTWNLQKGERVLPEYTAKRLDRTLDDVSKKGSGGGNVNIVFENHTSATISQAPSKDGEMRFIIRDEIDNYVPQQLSRTNSAISQALLQNTTATRRV